MNNEDYVPPRTVEDLHLFYVSGPPTYADTTDGPVSFVEVTGRQGLLGYLWAADADDAADFVWRDAAGDDALNAAVAWVAYLRECKAHDLSPMQALRALEERDYSYGGYTAKSAIEEASSLTSLKERAARE